MEEVQQRERKYKSRKTAAGRRKRRLEYQAAQDRRRMARRRMPFSADLPPASFDDCATPRAVLPSGGGTEHMAVISDPQEMTSHDRQAGSGPRSRASPST